MELNLSQASWKLVGSLILPIRFVQGFIFWGGGSRRLLYDPSKLEPSSHVWLANKLQSAMPGAILGTGTVIQFLLQHQTLLLIVLIIFSCLELISGIGLLLGWFTRFAAMLSVFFSISLLLMFGWQGSTCMDEWTMAVANLAMGVTLSLTGAPHYSIDAWTLKKYPILATHKWFVFFASGEVAYARITKFALWLTALVIIITLGTYNYYRGAIFSAYHAGPVSPTLHQLKLADGKLTAIGTVRFSAYVDAGSEAIPDYIIRIELLDQSNKLISEWKPAQLNDVKAIRIQNVYPYNEIKPGPTGLIAPVGAKAYITLETQNPSLRLAGDYFLKLYTIEGEVRTLPLKAESASTTGFA